MRQLLPKFSTRHCRRIIVITACCASGYSWSPQTARADSVSIANPVAITSTINLSSGGADWAHYATASPATDGVVGSTFDHPAGTRFSNALGINGTLEGYDTTNSQAPLMTWSGGTPDATGSSHSWEFNSNNYAESGESFTYDLAPGSKLIHLYVDAYNGSGPTSLPVELQAILSSGPSATNTALLPAFWIPQSSEDGDYAITAVNSSGSDETLTLNYFQPASQNGSANNGSNVGIFGVTAGAVPEPGTLSIAVAGSLGLLRRSRRRS